MKTFNKFIESKTEPSNKNDIWFDGNTWNMYKEGEWKPFTVPIEAAEKIKENLDSLKLFNIVEYLPDVGKDNIIYLLNNKNGSESNSLIEYIYINNKWEEIGSFTPSFDLDGYVKSEDLEKALKNKVDKVVNKGLSSNDYTTAEKQKLARLNNYDDTKLKEEIAETYQPKGNYLTNIPSDYVKKTDLAKINDKPLYNGGNIEITGGGGTSSGIYQSNIEDGSIAMTEDYGDFKAGTTVASLTGKKTYDELFDGILFPTVYPEFTNPSATIKWQNYSATQEVGANGPTADNFTTSYNAGAINLSGKEQAKRGGKQDFANSFIYVDGNINNQTLPDTVKDGSYTFNYRAAYAQGPQPKDNKGNNYDSPLAAGYKDSGAIKLTGTYYAFVGFTDSDPRDPSFNFRSFIGNGYTRLGKGNVKAGTCNKVWMVVCIPSGWDFTCNTGAGTSMRNNFTEEGNATITLPDNTTKDYKYYALTYPNGDFKDLVIK